MIDWDKQKGVNIYHGDCMDLMRSMPDNWANLAICDPPYGIGESGKTNHSRSKPFGSRSHAAHNTRGTTVKAKNYKSFSGDDLEPPAKEYFKELQRVSANQIIWGANHFMQNLQLGSPCWIVWDKINSGDFADCELAYTSFNTAVRKFAFMWNGMLQGDMKNKERRIHPTQKPVKLYQWLLKNYAKEGDKILDTHLGSGSSAIAAHYGGFDFVGAELDTDYFKAAQKRIKDETAQAAMF